MDTGAEWCSEIYTQAMWKTHYLGDLGIAKIKTFFGTKVLRRLREIKVSQLL